MNAADEALLEQIAANHAKMQAEGGEAYMLHQGKVTDFLLRIVRENSVQRGRTFTESRKVLLSRLTCDTCHRVWYEEFTGKTVDEIVGAMMTTRCPTDNCYGQVMLHAQPICAKEFVGSP